MEEFMFKDKELKKSKFNRKIYRPFDADFVAILPATTGTLNVPVVLRQFLEGKDEGVILVIDSFVIKFENLLNLTINAGIRLRNNQAIIIPNNANFNRFALSLPAPNDEIDYCHSLNDYIECVGVSDDIRVAQGDPTWIEYYNQEAFTITIHVIIKGHFENGVQEP